MFIDTAANDNDVIAVAQFSCQNKYLTKTGFHDVILTNVDILHNQAYYIIIYFILWLSFSYLKVNMVIANPKNGEKHVFMMAISSQRLL